MTATLRLGVTLVVATAALAAGRVARARAVRAASRPTFCGPLVESRGTLAAGAGRTLRLCVNRGVRVALRVDGTGGGDIDCYVYGPSRARVARDDDPADACVLSWRSKDSGAHRIELLNAGTRASDYRLRVP